MIRNAALRGADGHGRIHLDPELLSIVKEEAGIAPKGETGKWEPSPKLLEILEAAPEAVARMDRARTDHYMRYSAPKSSGEQHFAKIHMREQEEAESLREPPREITPGAREQAQECWSLWWKTVKQMRVPAMTYALNDAVSPIQAIEFALFHAASLSASLEQARKDIAEIVRTLDTFEVQKNVEGISLTVAGRVMCLVGLKKEAEAERDALREALEEYDKAATALTDQQLIDNQPLMSAIINGRAALSSPTPGHKEGKKHEVSL